MSAEQVLSAAPTLHIIEQPQRTFRSRYESEIQGDRNGSELHGRSGAHSCVQLRIASIGSSSSLRLTACTVQETGGPHPFYLRGDNCHNDYFKWERQTRFIDGDSVTVSLSKLTIVHTKRGGKDIERAMKRRQKLVPSLPDMPVNFDPEGDVNTLRLAFHLAYTSTDGHEYSLPTVLSDTIKHSKSGAAKLNLDAMNPTEFSFEGGEDFAIYCISPIAKMKPKNFQIDFVVDGTRFHCQVKEVKKHLIRGTAPKVQLEQINERISCICSVQLRMEDSVSHGKNFQICLMQHESAPVPSKAQRQALSAGAKRPRGLACPGSS